MTYRQGQTLDIKATPADFSDGDWSVPTTPRGPWCVWHGFYGDCPDCAGRSERWTFTVVGAEPDTLVIEETWVEEQGGEIEPGGDRAQRPLLPAVRFDHVPLSVNPGLLAKIRLLLEE